MQWAILKIKEGLAHLSLDLVYDLKGLSQQLFREDVPSMGYTIANQHVMEDNLTVYLYVYLIF
jgi:hypothetical protein